MSDTKLEATTAAIEDTQTEINRIQSTRQQLWLDHIKDHRKWQTGLATVAFTLAGVAIPIFFKKTSGDTPSISVLAGLLLLLTSGATILLRMKEDLEIDGRNILNLNSDMALRLLDKKRAAVFYQVNNDNDAWLDFVRSEIKLVMPQNEQNERSGPSIASDLAVWALIYGIYLLACDAVGHYFLYEFGIVLLPLLAFATTIDSVRKFEESAAKHKDDLAKRNQHAKNYIHAMLEVYPELNEEFQHQVSEK